ncbi:MAG: hypothetical protein U0R68_10750 [Candidatus Nanopelagicales bacterium]
MTDEAASGTARTGVRDRFWFQALAVVVVLLVIGLVVTRFTRRDVVQNWQVLATCPAEPGTAPATVTLALDPVDCASTPGHTLPGRGWPIVPFVLPATVGLEPRITKVLSDPRTRVMRLEYDATTSTEGVTGVVLVYVEMPESELPATPFTIEGASGAVTVSSVPAP